MPHSSQSTHAGTRWAVRIIPLVILGIIALATYAVVGRLCVDYLYKKKHQSAVITVFLTLFFLFLFLTLATYLRTFITVQRDPGLVPLLQDADTEHDATITRARKNRRRRDTDMEDRAWAPPDLSPDSPGLEEFYSKDIFVCEADGRPKWCSECRRWKPDRAHHSSELGRCVRKMDHFCPWVGGMVSETSFNFFVQFTFYCTLFCAMCLAVGVYSLRQQHNDGLALDAWTITVVVLACVFGSFSGGMVLTSLRFVLINTTNIDMLRKTHMMHLAVRIPRTTPPTDKYTTIIYPLRRPSTAGPQHNNNSTSTSSTSTSPNDAIAIRDQQAERKFAILRTQPRENPWNLGFRDNWKSVMGDNFVEWLLPIRHSPCCSHESMESDYKYGPLITKLRKRYGAPDIHTSRNGGDGIEMQAVRKERSH